MYYYEHEMTDDKEIIFKFLSDNQHWCLSALYDVKQDENNCNFFNNHISGSSLISREDIARDLSHSEKSQAIAHRIGKKNRAIENQLVRVLEKNADLFLPMTLVDEKVYFVPNDLKLHDYIKEKKLPIYLTGTLNNNQWIVSNEPCELDPDTNLYYTLVRRQLSQPIVFKFKIGDLNQSSYYEISTIYDKDGSAYVNN